MFTMGKEPTGDTFAPAAEPVELNNVAPAPVIEPAAPLPVAETAPAPKAAPVPTALRRDPMIPEISDKAWEFCARLSKSALLPETLRSTPDHDTTGDLYMMMMLGQSLDMGFIQTVMGVYCLPGARPALYTSTKRAIVMRAGGKFTADYFDEKTQTAICTVVRDGVAYTGRFSVQDAINRGKMFIGSDGKPQGIASKSGKPSPWRQDYRHMCGVRACGRACDLAYPDALMGLGSLEDMQDFQGVTINAAPVTEPAPAPALPNGQPDLQAALKPLNK